MSDNKRIKLEDNEPSRSTSSAAPASTCTCIKQHFQDEEQRKFDRVILELECKVFIGKYDEEYFRDEKMRNLQTNKESALRFMQSFIELAGTVLPDDMIDVAFGLFTINLSSDYLPTDIELMKLLLPYMKASCHCQCCGVTRKQRNVCLMFIAFQYMECSDELLSQKTIEFFRHILAQSERNSSILYVLSVISLFLLDHDQITNKRFSDNNFATLFEKHFESYSLDTLYHTPIDYLKYQIGFLAKWCATELENEMLNRTYFGKFDSSDAFDPNDGTADLKFSPDRLSVRCDGYGGNVRVSYPITCGVFYYEVILITSGWIKIGWATRQTDIDNIFKKRDEYSIWFSGFAQNIEETSNKPWKAGDVVGCLLDLPGKLFSFFLNGEPVNYELNEPVDFSTEPYFAAVGVAPLQQCYANFGQAPFRHPPPTPFRTIHQSIKKCEEEDLCPFCNERKIKARFLNCDDWKVCAECLTKLPKCPTCGK